jgi:hypothetical protein
MSVWPELSLAAPALCGSEGELVSVGISVEPRLLEELLEALAQVSFPINPQIYHHGAVAYVYSDGRQDIHPATMVEFPAYASRVREVRDILRLEGFPGGLLHVRNMLEEIHSDHDEEPAPGGAPYQRVIFYKQMARA